MELVSENNGFTFIWKIHNFSYCVQRTGEFLDSPSFSLNTGKGTWTLELFPRGTTNHYDSIAFRLWHSSGLNNINIAFSTFDDSGSVESAVSECSVPAEYKRSSVVPLQMPAVHKIVSDTYGNDTFTIKCKIIKVDGELLNYQSLCRAYTIISCKKTVYNWNIATLKSKKFITIKKPFQCLSFTADVSLEEKFSCEDSIKISFIQEEKNMVHCTGCTLRTVVAGKILQTIRKYHMFDKSEVKQSWEVSLMPPRNLLSYPQADTFLCLEISVSDGNDKCQGIESIEHGTVLDLKNTVNCSNIYTKPMITYLSTWKENLTRFYNDGSGALSNLTIQTPTKPFPVHKAMLSSQSPVFRAMFEHDTKENQTGIIAIEDLEEDTVSKMLLYIYSGPVENLDWDSAKKLYFAADKYRIAGLLLQCSDFLKQNLNAGNVCEILVLADLHQDQDLKSVAQEFVVKHAINIINFEKWKNFMKENIHLAAETMHLLCLRNFNII